MNTRMNTKMNTKMNPKLGIGWRPQLALSISRRSDIEFVEIVAENYMQTQLPKALLELKDRGVEIIPHCISLSPGGSKLPDIKRVRKIDRLAKQCGAKIVSDHLCFVRAAGIESGHLLPVPRSQKALKVIIDNINFIKSNLGLPFAIENIASLCQWENSEFDEASFFAEVLEETDSLMLLDLSNLYANSVNFKFEAHEYLKKLPLHRLAYIHIAGGSYKAGLYHDTHADPVKDEVFELLARVSEMTSIKKVMLERDGNFNAAAASDLNAELDRIKNAATKPLASGVFANV